MKRFLPLLGLSILLSGCYSARNTAKIRTGVNAAYIAPKGFNKTEYTGGENSEEKKYTTNLSSGAYFFDASMRMGVSNVIEKIDDEAQYQVRYLAEEQPDVAREIARTLNASAEASKNEKDPQALKAKAELITSLTSSVQKLTNKSSSLNLSRSILYRFNENVYNGADNDQLELFGQAADSLIKLQEKELYTEIENLARKKEVLNELNTLVAQMKELGFSKDRIDQIISTVLDEGDEEKESILLSESDDTNKVNEEKEEQTGNESDDQENE
ncbi:hypothetical protein J1N09_15185 [Aureitalea sp. L0-47]|uniref:hypothetical protein n=1 Tax=Aureitalea sp. L0-47 TaxID=2816962 RepID=UPI0022390A3E|nr:hypothetical protein [Aureitalea sp. L0-47]MCW5521191.1 hypothetical protein [Aureitalea sp. L0-47]